ncbi:hypothetical protein Pmani_034520 [Petrolisthes manimaculis]|uniref:Uncharacterized protein n=1 Tax=Petrolisthes manimaculis TaxID=1843537 RepID=A0AAE1NMA2_9EUCA|nr:hypothetical protein Pmani_034520 [Petrolisthes manimaculis]
MGRPRIDGCAVPTAAHCFGREPVACCSRECGFVKQEQEEQKEREGNGEEEQKEKKGKGEEEQKEREGKGEEEQKEMEEGCGFVKQ